MDSKIKAYLTELYQSYHADDQKQADRLNRWRSIEPESAELLSVLISATQAKNLLEIGTSGGYSTLWLAEAAQQYGGHLTTLEIEADRIATATSHLKAVKLNEICDTLCIDAADFLKNNQTVFDFILLDAERPAYPSYWPDLKRALSKSGSLMVVDNVISHAAQVQDFIELIRAETEFKHTILPVGAGLLLVVKK